MELDRRGLPLSTGSAEAAERYRAATELFLLGLPGAADAFAATAALDPSCGEAHVGRAFAAFFEGDLPAGAAALRAAEAAGPSARCSPTHCSTAFSATIDPRRPGSCSTSAWPAAPRPASPGCGRR